MECGRRHLRVAPLFETKEDLIEAPATIRNCEYNSRLAQLPLPCLLSYASCEIEDCKVCVLLKTV
jgi:hypothetical protein